MVTRGHPYIPFCLSHLVNSGLSIQSDSSCSTGHFILVSLCQACHFPFTNDNSENSTNWALVHLFIGTLINPYKPFCLSNLITSGQSIYIYIPIHCCNFWSPCIKIYHLLFQLATLYWLVIIHKPIPLCYLCSSCINIFCLVTCGHPFVPFPFGYLWSPYSNFFPLVTSGHYTNLIPVVNSGQPV